VSQHLGRIAEVLVERLAKLSLNEIQDLLAALDSQAYEAGLRDGQESADDCANQGAEQQYEWRLDDRDCGC
jgi:hypothetical protein